MAKVKLRETRPTAKNHVAAPPQAIPIKPLHVSGDVINRRALVEALQLYIPNAVDIMCTDDGEHYWIMIGESVEGGSADDSAAREDA